MNLPRHDLIIPIRSPDRLKKVTRDWFALVYQMALSYVYILGAVFAFLTYPKGGFSIFTYPVESAGAYYK